MPPKKSKHRASKIRHLHGSQQLNKNVHNQVNGISQDLETGGPNLAIVKFWGILFFKGEHNILRLQPFTCIHSLKLSIKS